VTVNQAPSAELRLETPRVNRRLETPRAAGVAGLVFSVFFVLSILLLSSLPAAGSSTEEIQDFYVNGNTGSLAIIGLNLVPFAGIAFLWFIAVIRNLIGDREDRFFATVFLGSGLLFVAMLLVAAGVGGALLASLKFQDDPVPSPEAVALVRSLAFAILFICAVRMAAVFMIVVSTIGRSLGIFPRWLVLGGYVAAVVLLLNVFYVELLVLVFPAWVAAVSVVILRVDRSLIRPGVAAGLGDG
jgi:hypothetical protein